MEGFDTNFTQWDWLIVVLYIGGSVAAGVYVNRYIGSFTDFIVAGRGLKLGLAIATMTGTEIGLVTVMYNAEQGFVNGFAAYHIGIFWFAGLLFVGLTGFIVYRLRELKVATIPEFYEIRFGRTARWLGGAILALAGILNMGLFLQAGGRFMTSVTGLGTGLPLKLMMTAMLCLVLLYTTLGGMIAVVLTDYVQFVVLGAGIVGATALAVSFVSWDGMVTAVNDAHGIAGFNPVVNEGYGIPYIIWMSFLGVAAGTLWQTATSRALAARSPEVAKKVYFWSSITFLSRVVLPMTWGIAAFAFIKSTPHLNDWFFGADAPPGASQYAMPVFLAHMLRPGVIGILAAGMLAAFMSTHDSYLLAWSTVITQDVIAPLSRRELSDRQRIRITRILILLMGVFLLVWGLWYEAPVSLWNYMAVTGTIYLSGAFVCVALGLYWRRASRAGAIGALLCGLLAFGGLKDWTVYPGLDWMTDTVIGLVTIGLSLTAMVVGSLLCPDAARERKASADDAAEEDA